MECRHDAPGMLRCRRQGDNCMFWRRFAVLLAVLLTAMVSLAGVTNSVQASGQASPNGALLPAPKEGPKVILGETSIDGPAIAVTDRPATVLAWTGTDR